MFLPGQTVFILNVELLTAWKIESGGENLVSDAPESLEILHWQLKMTPEQVDSKVDSDAFYGFMVHYNTEARRKVTK